VSQALQQIGELHVIEAHIRDHKLVGESKRMYRLTHSKPVVAKFFDWIDQQFQRQGLLPSNPFTKALAYTRERRACLEVFLTDAEVPINTNHLERALRAIPMGRKNWMFCWTELGAKHVGIVQSLIVTCRLHDIDPYLVDVLQRVAYTQPPASPNSPPGCGNSTSPTPPCAPTSTASAVCRSSRTPVSYRLLRARSLPLIAPDIVWNPIPRIKYGSGRTPVSYRLLFRAGLARHRTDVRLEVNHEP